MMVISRSRGVDELGFGFGHRAGGYHACSSERSLRPSYSRLLTGAVRPQQRPGVPLRCGHDRAIVFFADEGGTWQFSIDWKRVLPPYFRCLAEIHDWQEFECRALAALDEFVDSWGKDGLKAMVAKEVARPDP